MAGRVRSGTRASTATTLCTDIDSLRPAQVENIGVLDRGVFSHN